MCLYALFLANWLAAKGSPLADRYFVSDRVFLWKHVEMPKFAKILSTKAGGDEGKRFAALVQDLEDGLVNYLVFMPSVRKFFVEDVPRVVQKGDSEGWDSIEYHVNPRCGSCDWLGHEAWLSSDDKEAFEAHPEHYCFQNAEMSDHLSKLPGAEQWRRACARCGRSPEGRGPRKVRLMGRGPVGAGRVS